MTLGRDITPCTKRPCRLAELVVGNSAAHGEDGDRGVEPHRPLGTGGRRAHCEEGPDLKPSLSGLGINLRVVVVEEVMRFESSQVSWRRITTRDTVVGDLEVPAGTTVFLNFASANRQADIWNDPDTFDIHRPNANHHISFGKGIHFCLGARYAKFEAQVVTEILTERIPALRLVDDQDLAYFPNITFRGPTELQVAW